MKPKHALAVLTASLLAVAVHAGVTAQGSSARALADFDRIKALAGDWCVGEDGVVAEESTWSFRVTAGGNAVLETLFQGSEHEMITVYHVDAGGLALTHYCVAGNHPHMHALEDVPEDSIAFECVSAAGLETPDEAHMHTGSIQILGPDDIRTEWRMFEAQENTYTASFHLRRSRE